MYKIFSLGKYSQIIIDFSGLQGREAGCLLSAVSITGTEGRKHRALSALSSILLPASTTGFGTEQAGGSCDGRAQ